MHCITAELADFSNGNFIPGYVCMGYSLQVEMSLKPLRNRVDEYNNHVLQMPNIMFRSRQPMTALLPWPLKILDSDWPVGVDSLLANGQYNRATIIIIVFGI